MLLFALCLAACGTCQAGVLGQYCDAPTALNAAQQDRLFRFGARVKQTLDDSGASVALVARSGLDLSRFGLRYSHAGISLKASPNTPWSVRQLYYACDERRPRLFDQGLSGFLLGTDDPHVGYLSVVLLPPEPAAALEHAARDNARALALLSTAYSANAYAWGLQYQNCNQWLMELLANAWSDEPGDAGSPRAQAQTWLLDHGYRPARIEAHPRALMALVAFVPWLHNDDHPAENLADAVYEVSMPASIEAFVRSHLPGAQRWEFCHTDQQIVIHRGWDAIAEGCQPGDQDRVLPLTD